MRSIVELALFTHDVPSLVAFYEDLLGGAPEFQSEQMALFQLGGLHILIHHKSPANPDYEVNAEGPPYQDHFAIAVTALDNVWSDSDFSDVSGAIAPTSYPWGRSAYTRDPDGRLIEIQEK